MFKRVRGFTIAEVLIVIVVLGILMTITTLGVVQYQARGRDAERASKATVIIEALEKYYDKNGEYPSCPAITASPADITSVLLPGVDPDAFRTPKSTTSETNSIKCTDLTSVADNNDIFAYIGDGSAACNTGASCLKWTLKYQEEASNSIKTIQSRRNTSIATSNTTSLSVNITGFTTATATWGVVQNATSYEFQHSTNSAFTANLQTSTVPATTSPTFVVTGLSYDTQYYFRVRAITPDSQGDWMTSSGRTWELTYPNY